MSNRTVQVYEYGYLIADDVVEPTRASVIPHQAFEYLKMLALSSDSASNCLRLKGLGRTEAIQFLNYAGVIVTPDGTHIEILPKVAKIADSQNSIAESKAALMNMLKSLGEFRHIQTGEADVMRQNMPLLEVFVRQFLESVSHLIKKGLKREYCPQEENLFYLKGKLNITQQIKHNTVLKHRFHVSYDEYLPDITVNRILKAALEKVLKLTRSSDSQRRGRELLFVFADVASIVDSSSLNCTDGLGRGMEHYRSAVAWAKLILLGMSPLSMKGQTSAFSLLFPLEAVFESYVEQVLRNTLAPKNLQVKGQVRSQSLATFCGRKMFTLKPDITVFKGKQIKLIMDTKWKLVDDNLANGSDKFNLSQADFYQMFAYGHKYLEGAGDVVLIFPAHENFGLPLDEPFRFSDTLRLWVVPFDIAAFTANSDRLRLPEYIWTSLTKRF